MKAVIIFAMMLVLSPSSFAQPMKLVLDDSVFVTMNNGTYIILANKSDSAITLTGTKKGAIISEDEDNQIRWRIGDTTGTYYIPFATGGTNKYHIPTIVNVTAAGVGTSGYFLFSTYATTVPNNSPWLSPVTCFDLEDCTWGPLDPHYLNAVDRWWVVDGWNYTMKPALNMRLSYLNSEHTAPNVVDPTLLRAHRFNDGIGEWAGYQSGAATVGSVVSYVSNIVVPSTDLFYSWVVADYSTALPVELVDFEVNCTAAQREIQWKTLSEIDNDYFVVEKSFDAVEFEPYMTVQGQGNSQETIQYSIADPGVRSGAYYRLKQVDFDGASTYSDVVYSSPCGEGNLVTVFPNPSDGLFSIRSIDITKGLELVVSDVSGKTIAQGRIQHDQEIQLNLSAYEAGVYFLKVSDGLQNEVLRLIRQ